MEENEAAAQRKLVNPSNGLVVRTYHFRGSLFENYELAQFPFDMQVFQCSYLLVFARNDMFHDVHAMYFRISL
jgi:hypothetical protein